MKRIDKKVVIVTGGSLGIGRETCLLLAKEGAKVAVTDILDKEGQQLVEEINKNGGVAKYWHLDVSKEKEVEKVISLVVKEFGKLDAIVNNAGITGVNKPTHELSEEEWDAVMIPIWVGILLFQTFHSLYAENGSGSIVNLSSIYGLVGGGDIPPYHAAKAAVTMMSKNDALTYAKNNIRVNSVHPGGILTPLVEQFYNENPGFKEYNEQAHPVGHIGEPIDIAYGILYLVSDESKFVTGAELVIDGGYTCK